MSNKIVLLIEDNVNDERLTLRALRKNNVMNEIVVAVDGQEALDYLYGNGKYQGRNTSDLPALIILDLNLPGVSGMDVLKTIRSDKSTSGTPVVVLTAIQDPSAVDAAYRMGANSFIVKPTDHAEFTDMVLHIGMYWLLLNEAPPLARLTA